MFRGDTVTALVRRGVVPALLFTAVALTGCYQKMGVQPALDPYDQSEFFEDRMSARPRVEGTVAVGELREDEHLFTGREGGQLATRFPFPITEDVLDRGQQRFNIYCTPCHGPTGEGDGMIVRRGYKKPKSYHEADVVAQPAGYYFSAITNGFGVMPSYAAQIPVEDRWAIVAYIRALQLSQRVPAATLSPEEVAKLNAPPAAEHAAAGGAH